MLATILSLITIELKVSKERVHRFNDTDIDHLRKSPQFVIFVVAYAADVTSGEEFHHVCN